MSAAAASAEQPAPKKNSKKLFIIIGVVVFLLVGGGAAGFMIWKKKAEEAAAAAAEEGGGDDAHEVAKSHKPAKRDPKLPPAYMPLEPFVVNLADRDADRYAQIGITLEVEDAKFAEEMKAYMPAIRNAVLMILSHKTAAEIAREVVRPLGINIDEDSGEDGAKKKKKRTPVYNPVLQVNFSSFIVQ